MCSETPLSLNNTHAMQRWGQSRTVSIEVLSSGRLLKHFYLWITCTRSSEGPKENLFPKRFSLVDVRTYRCSTHIHSQPGRLGHDLVPFQRPETTTNALERGLDGGGKRGDAKKAKRAARSLPDCAKRAESCLKSMALLKHKVSLSVDICAIRWIFALPCLLMDGSDGTRS